MRSFKKGNHIFSVHINSIAGKNKMRKPLGRNPLLNLGITVSQSGYTITLWELFNGKWREYDQLDGSSSYRLASPCAKSMWGEGYNLTHFYPIYDWVADDGYNNFGSWVD